MTSASPLPPESRQPSRDEASWARNITRLNLSDKSAGGIASNVEGRRVSGPLQGFGQMWQKRHWVKLTGADVTPAQVIQTWKENFGTFWPRGNRFYGPITGLRPGEVAVINLSMPARTTLSTGVLVLYADDESFTLMTPQGHVFAGWITFSAFDDGDAGTVAQAQVLMRASDPIYEVGLTLGGHRQEDRFWNHTLTRLAAHFDHDCEVDTQVVCVDGKRQWSKWRNVWHSAAIRSTLYTMGAPGRLVKGRFHRDRAVD